MRPMWSGSLSFGLVNIPVKLYKATGEDKPGFHLLHKDDLSRVRYVRVCEQDGKEIPFADLVHGYEYKKGEYIALTAAELEKANVRKTKTIEITAFIDPAEVDPTYFEQPYYLEPDSGAEKAYALLRKALTKTGRAAVGKFVFSNRERLGIIRPSDDVLVLEQIRYKADFRETGALNLPPDSVATDAELKMAVALVEQQAGAFDPANFHDTYREDIERVVAEKVAGRPATAAGEAPVPTRAKDLMEALLASMEKPAAKR
jgi:DNA end-binding protein Ku